MIRNIPRLQVRTFVDERNDGMVWVPYKTLIGYNIPNRPIIGRLWEDMSCIEEFASKDEAVKEAKRQAWVRILELFGHVEQAEVEWEVIHNRHHTFVKLTHEDTREARSIHRRRDDGGTPPGTLALRADGQRGSAKVWALGSCL
jgi:hypothetical protein